MALQMRWVGDEDLERVAQTRMFCYAHGTNEIERLRENIRTDTSAKAGDYLLAEQDSLAVGTATSLSQTMWVRGSAVPCQGVAWVGTIKTHRRRTDSGDGVATQIMRQVLRRAREREQVVSALMPFRASYYEHFGYGVVERRNEWTTPLSVLPAGPFDGIRFHRPDDLEELTRHRQRVVERGQCDIERSREVWQFILGRADNGFIIVDRPQDGPVRGYMILQNAQVNGKDHLRVWQNSFEDIAALQRQLHFLASLRDQHAAAVLTLPADLPLRWLLRETQLPHRPVNHATAELRQYTRMQVRVLDHKRLLEGLKLPVGRAGRVNISVRECEGTQSRFAVEISDGSAIVLPAAESARSASFECPDTVWAAIACGDLSATRAVELGIAQASGPDATQILDALSEGPLPFCNEYF